MPLIKSFCPGGVTSFFEPYKLRSTKKKLTKDLIMGARGGGFTLKKGTTTWVKASRSRTNKISIFIRKKPTENFHTTKTVTELLLKKTARKYRVSINHNIDLPIGAGYGTSAAGALSTALAMNEALGLGLTFDELGFYAHVAEIRCKTGLGTVGPQMVGGCIIQREGGPPGLCKIDQIPINRSYRIVSGYIGPISTSRILSSNTLYKIISAEGGKTMQIILSNPTLRNFLTKSEEFASNIGLMTERIRRLIKITKKNGSVGATQNMLGEAFHGIADVQRVPEILDALNSYDPMSKFFSTAIDFEGARLV
ncbi:pantoate kinase [[Eubacterium] cellulosolvens]